MNSDLKCNQFSSGNGAGCTGGAPSYAGGAGGTTGCTGSRRVTTGGGCDAGCPSSAIFLYF